MPQRPPSATLLSGLSPRAFLRDHWQNNPVLIRQAMPGIQPPLDPQALCDLANDDAVESRLISAFGGRWQMRRGPFDRNQIPALSRKRWTLLVQGVDLHLDVAQQLLSRFRFLPDARLDDLMISLASDQGGVGPHVDAYDVFLLQVWGKRRWRVAPPGDESLKPGLPLKILERFAPCNEWLLEPGDMLYLPPGWGHDGVAEGPCMTASIGFRAPSRGEFLREFLSAAADAPGGSDPRFSDPGRPPARRPAAIPDDLHGQLAAWARDWRPDPALIDTFIGRFLTEPKPSVWFDSRPLPASATLVRQAGRRGLRLDRRTRMLYRKGRVFVNGEAFDFGQPTQTPMKRLADQRRLEPADCVGALGDGAFVEAIRAWISHGWMEIG
jgi:50S ribosomal protein L16 3-hydroxylase